MLRPNGGNAYRKRWLCDCGELGYRPAVSGDQHRLATFYLLK
jgi:hypothetical protein